LDNNLLIGRCRCKDHADNYRPRTQNVGRKFYFIPPEYVAASLYCGACYLVGREKRGGLVISEESKNSKVVLFEGFCAVKLTQEVVDNAESIWPR
jgi:hypothetical protein